MNKEQAIDLLDNLIGMIEDNQDNDYDAAFRMAIEALKAQLSQEGTTSVQPVATDTNVGNKISKFIDGLEKTFAYIREREGGDSVCGLCEYDGAYIGESGDWCNECPGFNRDDCFKLSDETRKKWTDEIITICKHVGNNSEIPNSSDCISRQQAIDALDKIFPADPMRNDYTQGITCGAALATEYIKQLPSAQPELQWIPVSERMPDKNVDILLQFESNMTVGFYEDGDWAINTGDGIYSMIGDNEEKPIAWMPLPEPYQKGAIK